jgi:hypothetical protein
MKASLHKSARTTHCPTWHELARRLALHISWLHQSAPQTKASRTKIEQWLKQLATFPNTGATERGRRGGQR